MGSGEARPSGTVTFLFTDIEESTKRWEADPDAMRVDLAAHDGVLRGAVESHGGWLFKHTGDGVCAAFESARAAVGAAVDAQRALGLPVRMGLASGEAELRDDDYFGPTLNTAARVMAAGHGGQILVAESTASLVSDVVLVDLGLRGLRGLSAPVKLFQVCADGLRADFAALRTAEVERGNLRVPSSSFVGRDGEVDTVVEASGSHRVVTLIGVGGVGKTRLALQAATMLAPGFRDGAWLIELAPVTDSAGVDAAVAAVFTLQPQFGRSWGQVVVDGLRAREVLLVIDNCEHVLDATAALIESLEECAQVRVLVTSRESLGVRDEWAWRVPSLSDGAAVELFVERADVAASGFRPESADLAVIGEICTRLDGIPLAIELAAARVRSMSPSQIRDRLGERFRLLTGSRRSIERHQTLRHAVQWSYDLLDAVEQTVLQCVSVFVGGFALEAATAVTELDEFDVLDVLDSLVRKSLLHVDRTDAAVRYAMLETIRQFAEEALAASGNSESVRDRHAAYFADRSERAGEQYVTDDEHLAVRFVDVEITNLAAAFEWSSARSDVDRAVRVAAKVHMIARGRLRTETFGWPEQVLDAARQSRHRQLPSLLVAACDAATGVGRIDEAVRFGLEAIDLNDEGDFDVDISAHFVTAMALFILGDLDQSLSVVRFGAEHPADQPVRGNLLYLHVLAHLGGAAVPEDETFAAIGLIKASSMPAIRAGGSWVHANLMAGCDATKAIALYQEAIDASSGSRILEEMCRSMQLDLIARTDDLNAALDGFAHVVNAWQASGGDVYTGQGIVALSAWVARLGYHRDAAQFVGVATLAGRELVLNLLPELRALPEILGAEVFDAEFDAGAALDPVSSANMARELIARIRAEHAES